MKKAVSKRFRITKTGKVMRRKMAQGHFRANKSGGAIQRKRGSLSMSGSDRRKIRKYFGSGNSR